ncbi:MAG: COQ9 family protein [Sphingobium sp.]
MTQDLTLDEIRAVLAPVVAHHAAFDGWRQAAVRQSATDKGIDPDIAALAFKGAMDMIDAWFAWIDSAMLDALPAETLGGLSIRKRITALVEARLTLLAPDREALRRAMAVMAMPANAPRAAKLGWRAADRMWRAAGDAATDFSHYTKRTTLAGVYATTLLVFVDDESADWADTRAFLARRIEGVMRFEKFKAQMKGSGERLSLSRFIGRLRYPAV